MLLYDITFEDDIVQKVVSRVLSAEEIVKRGYNKLSFMQLVEARLKEAEITQQPSAAELMKLIGTTAAAFFYVPGLESSEMKCNTSRSNSKVTGGQVIVTSSGQDCGVIEYKPEHVKKRNGSPESTTIEYQVMQAFARLGGIRIAKPISVSEDGTELMEHLEGPTLEEYSKEFENRAKHRMISQADCVAAFNIFRDAVQQMSLISTHLNNGAALREEQKATLRHKQYAPLANAFGVTEDEAKQNYFAYRIMSTLGISDKRFIQEYKPIQEKLEHMLEKYGIWNRDEATSNRIIAEDGKTFAFDFNKISFDLMQRDEVLLLDLYPAITSDEQVTQLLQERVNLWNQQNPEKRIEDFKDYFTAFQYARIQCSFRAIGHALNEAEELKKNGNQLTYFNYAEKILGEAEHYITLVQSALSYLVSNHELSLETGKAVLGSLQSRISERLKQIVQSPAELKLDYNIRNNLWAL